MTSNEKLLPKQNLAAAIERRKVAQHLQSMESNPLDAEDIALFEMFEREAWPHERRRAYLLECIHAKAVIPAAE